MSLAVTTTAFSPGGAIPKSYTCDGADTSPDLSWSGAPSGVQSLALIADDPDASVGTWMHWLIWNIPAQSTGLPKGVPKDETLGDGTRQGRNGFRRISYGGHCTPPAMINTTGCNRSLTAVSFRQGREGPCRELKRV
jgi:Raf kinase inhibitor-like YbhB/YbcL family protein